MKIENGQRKVTQANGQPRYIGVVLIVATADPERGVKAMDQLYQEGVVNRLLMVNGWGRVEGSPKDELLREWARGGKPPDDFRGVIGHPEFKGVVPAYFMAMRWLAEHGWASTPRGELVWALIHDDVEVYDKDWAMQVLKLMNREWPTGRECALLGFGGGLGVGETGMFTNHQEPHEGETDAERHARAMTLARHDFRSNMRDAEAHGRRTTKPQRVAVLDGFSLIGDPAFLLYTWQLMAEAGIVHHAYDTLLGILANAAGKQVWLLPASCHHQGGQTAVANQEYQAWAREQVEGGDQGFWLAAHDAAWLMAKECQEKLAEAGKPFLPLHVRGLDVDRG